MESKNHLKSWVYLAPALIILGVFTFYPLVNTIFLSFQEGYNALQAQNGVTFNWGFANFQTVLDWSTPQGLLFYKALINTSIIVFITVPVSTLLALLISVALNSIKPLQKILQTIYFLPYITNTLAIAAVFAVIFQSSGKGMVSTAGVLNNILAWLHLPEVDWLNGTNFRELIPVTGIGIDPAGLTVICVYDIWAGLPFKILILLGALQSVNKQCYEAAKIDSTPKRRVLWKITVPLISPMISYLMITGFIGAFKEYTTVVGLFGDGMGNNRNMITIVGFIYQFIDGDKYAGSYGVASAASLVLLVIIMIFTALNFYLGKKRVHF